MKGKAKRSFKKKDGGKMRKMRDTVDRFIQSQAEGEGEDEEGMDHGVRFVKRKSRKELRKEKRKLKKAKMKCHYEGKKEVDVTPGGGGGGGGAAGGHEPEVKKKKKKGVNVKEKKEDSETSKSKTPHGANQVTENPDTTSQKGGKRSQLQESRKKALLEANEAEEREIRMLERCLGYNKRRNKKNLPQSFVDDGLDYVLGILDSDSAAAAMYDSDEDVEAAKEKFAELDRSDSEMSAEEEEERGGKGGESEDEGGEDDDLMDEENDVVDDKEEDDDEMVEEEDADEEEEDENNEEEAAGREASYSSGAEPVS